MSSEKKSNWYLYNSISESRINALTHEQANEILLKINKEDLQYWFAWNKKMKDWKHVEQLVEFQELFKEKVVLPPPPPPPPTFSPPKVPKTDLKANEFTHNKKNQEPVFQEKRKHKRYSIELKIIFKKEDTIFRTFTKNISLGGVALKHTVPAEFMQEDCEIILSSPQWNENIKFKGRVAENINSRSRVQFVETNEYFADKLEQWLKEINESHEDDKKSAA